MSSVSEEIELLERVLFRLGTADSDEKLENAVGKFLPPVLLKITSPHEIVRCKVMEVLTHVNKRLKSRSLVQIPIEALFDQYQSSDSTFLHNFSIIYITMGFPRLPIEKQAELTPKLFKCLESKPETHQDKLLLLVLPLIGEIKLPDDPAKRLSFLGLQDKPNTKKQLISLLQDVLLLPYGITQDAEVPPGLSYFTFKRIVVNNWKAEELEQLKKGIVKFVCSGIFTELESFILLVLASSDTRFSVATPAIAELSKVCTSLDFTQPNVTAPLYTLFSGNTLTDDRKTTPCSARVRQKLLQYLIKSHGKGINTVKGIQVIFEGLFGDNTNQKCKVLALQFCENLVKDGPKEIISKISKVILSGLSKLIGRESTESFEVQNSAYSAIAQLARTCPDVVNQDLKIVVSYFNHFSTAPIELHTAIREALVSMAPAFAWNYNAMETGNPTDFVLSSQQNLLLAMLTDNAESKLQIVQNVSSVFLTICFPDHFAPARYLLLLIAGDRSALRESVTTYLYGVSKKDHINYNMLSSIDCRVENSSDDNKAPQEQRRVTLPSFKEMVNYITEMTKKRLSNSSQKFIVGKTVLPFHPNVYVEILDYLRICLWFSAGARTHPGDDKYLRILKDFILENYEESENNEIYKYLQLIRTSVEAKRDETNLICLFDLLNAAPEILTKSQTHLLDPLSLSLKDVSENLRIQVAQVFGILLAYGLETEEFNRDINEILSSFANKSLENRHGLVLALGHAFSRRIMLIGALCTDNLLEYSEFVKCVELIVQKLCDQQLLLVSAAIKAISLIGKSSELPEFGMEFIKQTSTKEQMEIEESKITAKAFVFDIIFGFLKNSSTRAKIREDSATCLGYLAIGDGKTFTKINLEKFLTLVKISKDAGLNIAIAQAIACTICGYDVNTGPPSSDFVNPHCDDTIFEWFLNTVIKFVTEPNPHARQATSVWLLALVKNCSKRPILIAKKQMLQYAFTELLSDDSEFVQDVASRGLGLVYSLSDLYSQTDLANSLLDQLIGGKRQVNQVAEDTELFAEGVLGKTPTGGNITTYKELCSLASDLNQPEMIYQFMQLANHNATWNSKLGAAFGLKSISREAKVNMQPFLGKIIPRLYRYKYDPTPKIQNSMISIWDSVVSDSKETIELYYWDILREILSNLTTNEWRVRIACCLAVRDLIKRPKGLRLKCEEKNALNTDASERMIVDDDVPEPELRELWAQLFRVMDDIHEGTRLAAEGTVNILSKICVVAASNGKSGTAVAGSILPLLLDVGVTHTVPEIRKISIRTISELIDSSGELITPNLPNLIPCLLRATGELETPKLSYLSTKLGNETDAQETVDSIRAEAAKSHHTMETIAKCIRYINYAALEKMSSDIIDLIKSTVNLGTKIGCAHFICLISIRLGQEMTPIVGKYLSTCFNAMKDRNPIVRKYFASAIGHLIGVAKEQSVKNLFVKLSELYEENPSNRGVPQVIHSINKRHHELLKDYMEYILPLIFLAMHEEVNDDNKSNVELWKELWLEISPGDSGIRINLSSIISQLEKAFNDPSWLRKVQGANGINTIAIRLGTSLNETRFHLIKLLLNGIPGRSFQGKERLLQALSSICKGLNKDDPICIQIVDTVMKECRKEDPLYRIHALKAIGEILEELQIDRFQEVYNMIWYILDKKEFQAESDVNEISTRSLDERSKQAQIFNKLKETVCETLGNSWPVNSIETQQKFQLQFVVRCVECLKNNTRPVQISLLVALNKFLDRLKLLEECENENKEKKPKVDQNRDDVIDKMLNEIFSAIIYVSNLPHTGLKKESLNIILILLKKFVGKTNEKHAMKVKTLFVGNVHIFEKDPAPEVRCRIKDIKDKVATM